MTTNYRVATATEIAAGIQRDLDYLREQAGKPEVARSPKQLRRLIGDVLISLQASADWLVAQDKQ